MEAEKIQVIGVSIEKKLAVVVHHDLHTHNQTFYKVTKMDADEIKDLLNNKPLAEKQS